MGMFDQLKDVYQLQKEAKEMQKKMKAITIDAYSDDEGVRIVMNGLQEIEDIEIDDELLSVENKRKLIKEFKEALKSGQKKLQKELSKGMDLSQLKNMLGSN